MDFVAKSSFGGYTNVGFTGQRIDILDDGNLTMNYYKNRWYDTETGRFLSQDPLGVVPSGYENILSPSFMQYWDGMNSYLYAKSLPISNSDIYGLCTKGQLECLSIELKLSLPGEFKGTHPDKLSNIFEFEIGCSGSRNSISVSSILSKIKKTLSKKKVSSKTAIQVVAAIMNSENMLGSGIVFDFEMEYNCCATKECEDKWEWNDPDDEYECWGRTQHRCRGCDKCKGARAENPRNDWQYYGVATGGLKPASKDFREVLNKLFEEAKNDCSSKAESAENGK